MMHWTPTELAEEVVARQIVPSISVRHVGRFFKRAELQPHRSQYWRNANPKDAPTKPMRPGQTEKVEFEHKRHGTPCLIGNFEVTTG